MDGDGCVLIVITSDELQQKKKLKNLRRSKLINQNSLQIIELAFVKMLPMGTELGRNQGRLKSLFQRLERQAEREMSRTIPVSTMELEKIKELAFGLQIATGWTGKSKHPATAISFVLDVIDSKNFGSITEILFEIIDYYERAKKLPPPCNWAGHLAAEKWRTLLEEAE